MFPSGGGEGGVRVAVPGLRRPAGRGAPRRPRAGGAGLPGGPLVPPLDHGPGVAEERRVGPPRGRPRAASHARVVAARRGGGHAAGARGRRPPAGAAGGGRAAEGDVPGAHHLHGAAGAA